MLHLLEERSSVTVAELSELFQLSEVSVRKLLMSMEQDGQLKRTWGGAVSIQGSLREFSHKEKEPKNFAEKRCIAQLAYDCIADGDAVLLDAGTTTAQLARLIVSGSKRNIMVGTNAMNIAVEMAEAPDIPVIVIGGELRPNILSCVGHMAEEALGTLFFDKGFISGNHFTITNGFTTPTLQEAKIKKLMIKACKAHYVLLDYSKFGDDSLAQVIATADLDGVITDWKTPEATIKELRERNVKVIQGQV